MKIVYKKTKKIISILIDYYSKLLKLKKKIVGQYCCTLHFIRYKQEFKRYELGFKRYKLEFIRSKLKFIRYELEFIRSKLKYIRSKLKYKRLKLEYKRYGLIGVRHPTISGAQLIIWNVEFLTLLVKKMFCELDF